MADAIVPRIARLAWLGAFVALSAACGVEPNVPGLLEKVCLEPSIYYYEWRPCLLSGDVAEATGLVEGDLAYRFGPSGGALQIPLASLPYAADGLPKSLDVLAAASSPTGAELLRNVDWGGCGVSCPAPVAARKDVLGEDPAWWPVLEGVPWYANYSLVPGDAVLRFSGANLDLYELRLPVE